MRVYTDKEKVILFGNPVETPGRFNKSWANDNLVHVTIPQLKGVPTYGGYLKSGLVLCHKKIANKLKLAFNEIERAELLKHIEFWGGCAVPRLIAGTDRLSSHAYGIAIDINPDQNRYGQQPAGYHEPGTVLPLVYIFQKHGFAWGGYWNVPDGMHFEMANLDAGENPIELIENIIKDLNKLNKIWSRR